MGMEKVCLRGNGNNIRLGQYNEKIVLSTNLQDDMKRIFARKVSETLFELDSPVILEQNRNTRRIFHGQVAKQADGNWGIRGWIQLEKHGPDGWRVADEAKKISELAPGELLQLELRTEHVNKLFQGLTALYEVAELVGPTRKSARLLVGRQDELVQVPQQYKSVIEELIKEQKAPEFWETLRTVQPDLAAHLADAEIQRNRRMALESFSQHLEALDWNEPAWERFFNENQWIFGYGLRYQFLGQVQNQANYGGVSVTGKGTQRGEFLMSTEALHRFTVLVEIKRPDSAVFSSKAADRSYRSGVPGFSQEFINAVSQVQVNARTWTLEGSQRETDREALNAAKTYTVAPRSILVFGHTKQLLGNDYRNSFELFRSHLHRPEIITFDELFSRARFIVEQKTGSE
jgi:hypothetical protein